MVRIRRPNMRSTRAMVAMCVICLFAGGVAAITLSNMISGTFVLYSGTPITLSWADDPSSGFVVVGSDNLGTIHYVNGATVAFTAIVLSITMTCPAGLTTLASKMYIVINGVVFLGGDFSGGSGTWTISSAPGAITDIGASASGNWGFNFKLMSGEPEMQGTWTVGIGLSGTTA